MTERTGDGTAYELSGPEGAPVIVLVHGLGLNRRMWHWHEPSLSARYRVLNYDLFGHGDSAPPPETPSLSLFSRQLCDLMDFLGVVDGVIAGFSLGGMINRRFALDYPDRVRALVIFNSPHERTPEAQRLVEDRAARTAEGGPSATLDSTIERWFTPDFQAARPEVIAMVRQWVGANDPTIYALCRQVLANGVVELIRPAPPIATPALVITAENDSGSTPAMAHAISAEIRGAQTLIVPHLKHMALVEDPSLYNEPVMRFLGEA